MIKLLLSLALSSITLYSSSQTNENPFKKLGYNPLVATLTRGQFEEFHDREDIVEIASVLYNTRTKEIVGFLEEGQTTIDIPAATAVMSIDPHCERYYWISPYVYAANNPIKYIDPDGKDGMVTGQGTKEDPYVITVSYFYQNGSLNQDQTKGLNAAVSDYNKSGGKDGVQVKNADGTTSYVKYNMTAQGVDNVDEARSATGFETISGETMYYGNIIGTNPNTSGSGDEFGSAHNFQVNFNVDNINLGVAQGMNSASLNRGVAVHEIGHNIGGEHSDGTSVMQKIEGTIHTSQTGGAPYTTYSYPRINDNFTRTVFGRRDTPRTPFSGEGRLWTKKR